MTAPETVSKRGFAELLGLTPGRVSQLVTAGLPVEPTGRIDVAKGRAWFAANVDRPRRPIDDSLVRSSKRQKEAADAEIAQLKAAKLAGNLIDRTAALRTIESRARFERDAWIGWVNRAAPEIASEVNASLPAVVAVLDRLIRDQLATLAVTPLDLEAT